MKKRILSIFLTVSMVVSIFMFTASTSASVSAAELPDQPELVLKYDRPAESWETEALPLGNGFMGAMVFGSVGSERIQINEHTLWSGGPGANASYNGGNETEKAAQLKLNLQSVRRMLQDKMTEFTKNNSAHYENGQLVTADYPAESEELQSLINSLMGSKNNFGDYQTLGNIIIAQPGYEEFPPVSIKSNAEPRNVSEGSAMLFDGNLGTKWYADGYPSTGRTYQINWEYSDPKAINSYNISSANDEQGRDPKNWRLYGSNNGTDYTLLDEQTNVTFENRQQTKNFVPKNNRNSSYTHYRLEITDIREPGMACQIAEIEIIKEQKSINYTDYQRTLDLDNALAGVTYTDKDSGSKFTSEYFISYPDNVMGIKLTSSVKGKLDRTIAITSEQPNKTITSSGDTVTMTGQPSDQSKNGIKFAQQIKVVQTGGTLKAANGCIKVTGADEIIIYMTAGTNYKQCMDDSFDFFKDGDPLDDVKARIASASAKGYNKVKSDHIADYNSLYGNVKVNFGASSVPTKTTDKLLGDYNKTNSANDNRYLDTLYYQFGRYLLIASSRSGSLPANLQGIWAEGLTNPWSSDYHTNINLQMNYWLAEQTNLTECHEPLIEYINSLVPRGKITASTYYCTEDGGNVRGWVTNHENNIWAHTAPSNYYWGYYFPTAAAWLCQDIYEYYKFNDDKAFMRENYDTMLSAALFWVDNLWTDTRDGTLVANPSFSPEHGQYSMGASADQEIIYELFSEVIEVSEDLGITSSELDEIKAAKDKLYMPKIGLGGELLEWKDEQTMDITGDNEHRHANHLFLIHPASTVVVGRSADDDKMAAAIKKVLEIRGDNGTGWSKAWKINFWARLHDGDHAMTLVKQLFGSSTLTNLFDNHPPFQIDGNFGATAGMTEMMLQSQGDSIELLPAISKEWADGKVSGIKARGNFEISMDWANGELTGAEVSSLSGNECRLKYSGIGDLAIMDTETGKAVEVTKISNDEVSFNTEIGKTYGVVDPSEISASCDLAVSEVTPLEDNITSGDQVGLYTTIRNRGNYASNGEFTVYFLVDGIPVEEVKVNKSVAPGESINISTTGAGWKAIQGAHTVAAVADFRKALNDDNYSNNIIRSKIAVNRS